jgi:alcohol dehydrogenase class IV
LLQQLNERGIETTVINIPAEPTIDMINSGMREVRNNKCDAVIGFGGGSVVDAGKAIAALLANPGNLIDYLEVIGNGLPLPNKSAPYIAVPTTAGAGSEVTANAVLTSLEHRVKVSLRSHLMLPSLAVVDPELTYTLPPALTASTGLDALTQILEAFTSNRSNPLTDALCREGMQRAGNSLGLACKENLNVNAREDMCIASLFSGLALANAKLGAVHGLSGTLGGMFSAPHGFICARLLPHVIETNVRALQQRMPHSPILSRYQEIARILTGDDEATAYDGVRWIQELCSALNIPSLSNLGVIEEDFAEVISQSQKASSMKGNPIVLTDDELKAVLEKAL